jgi:integrase
MNKRSYVLRRQPLGGEPPITPSSTVENYLEEWLWGKQSLRPSTHASYETHVRRYLVPHLGNLRLDGLSAAHVQRMYRLLANQEGRGGKQLSVASLRRIHATLMSALNTAVRRGLIDRNPAATVELPRAHRTRPRTWSPAELAAFLAAIEEDPLRLLYRVLGLAGLRRGEAVGLRWVDVDLNAGLLRVEQSLVKVDGRSVIGPPKSAAGARVVAIDDETARQLHWHREAQRLNVVKITGTPGNPDLVFTTPAGQPLDPAYVSRHFDRLVARQGMPRIRLHDLRHTSASIGLEVGESLLEVSRRLGHSSITITADVYSHLSPVVAKESAERLAHTVFGNH